MTYMCFASDKILSSCKTYYDNIVKHIMIISSLLLSCYCDFKGEGNVNWPCHRSRTWKCFAYNLDTVNFVMG